jgi:hypothetical protein
MNHLEQILRMELIEKSVVDRKRAAQDKGVYLDPTDPTKPMSIVTTDFETGKRKTYTSREALAAFKHAEKIKAAYGERASQRLGKARKEYKSLLKTDKTDKDYKEKIDKAERKLKFAQDDMKTARGIPDPDITNFKPELPAGEKFGALAKRALRVGASAIGTQMLGKLGDELVRNAPIGVPGGGDRTSRERAKQGAQNISKFLRKGLLGDTQADPSETQQKRFGLIGSLGLYGYDKLRGDRDPDKEKLQVIKGVGRRRDVFTNIRKGLGTSPYAEREIENLRLLKQLKPKDS